MNNNFCLVYSLSSVSLRFFSRSFCWNDPKSITHLKCQGVDVGDRRLIRTWRECEVLEDGRGDDGGFEFGHALAQTDAGPGLEGGELERRGVGVVEEAVGLELEGVGAPEAGEPAPP